MGAAALRASRAYTVWYLSLSLRDPRMYGGRGMDPILSISASGTSSRISISKVSPASVRAPMRTTRLP